MGVVLGSTLAPFGPPKCVPLGTLLALNIDQKKDPKSDCLEGRSKIAPRPPKTLPRCPPDPPGPPKMPPGPPPGCPKMPSRTPPDDPKCFPKPLAQKPFSENSKSSKKKVDNGHPRWSLASVAQKPNRCSHRSHAQPKKGWGGGGRESTTVIHGGHSHPSLKNQKHFQNGRSQRVAAVVARSALQ